MRINRKKRVLALTLAGLMACTMAACGEKDKKESSAAQSSEAQSSAAQSSEAQNSAEESSTADQGSVGESIFDNGESVEADSALSEMIQKIYEVKDPGIGVMDIPVDLTQEYSLTYYTGIAVEDGDKVDAALVSEAMINAQAYSLALVRAKDKADVPELAQKMADGIDQRKWICVEADDMQVVTREDLILLIMVQSELSDTVTSQDIVDAFTEAAGAIDGEYTRKTK